MGSSGDPFWIIDSTLKGRGFRLVAPPAVYRGPLLIHGQPATVEITIPDEAFVTLPEVRLVDHDKLAIPQPAHLGADNAICYVGDGGLPLDLYNPGGSILRVLEEARAAIERSFGGKVSAEYEAELAAYWGGALAYAALPPTTASCIERVDLIGIESADHIHQVFVPCDAWKHLTPRSHQQAVVFRFTQNLRHSDAFGSTSLAGILNWLEQQPDPPGGWRDAVIAATAENEAVLLVAPNALIGWRACPSPRLRTFRDLARFRTSFFREQIRRTPEEVELDRMTAIDCDLQFVIERNLSRAPSLIGKKIALVGCGTIGSHLAKHLVQCGAGCDAEFALYDTDMLRPGNLGRHALGFEDIGRPKAAALGQHLQRFHPDIQVQSTQKDALLDWDLLEAADLLVDATGDYNTSAALNNRWMQSHKTGADLAVIHGWVFGNGIAVQSFLNAKDEYACYSCLKNGFDGPWRHTPLRDPRSEITLAPARCGEGGYIPFAVDAPVTAAALMLRAILDWAAGEPGKRLRTTTLDQSIGRTVKWKSPLPRAGCPACRR